MRYRGYVSAVLAGSGALQATGQAATVQQEPQRLAVVIPAYDFGRVMFLGQWRSPCLYATQQNMDLVLLSGGEHEDAATAVDIAESAGPCFSNTVQAHIQVNDNVTLNTKSRWLCYLRQHCYFVPPRMCDVST